MEQARGDQMPDEDRGAPDVLGAYIRNQRRMADLSLRQLAGMTKISNAYLSQVERGLHQPSLRILRSIADALNIPGEDLLSHAGMPAAGPEKAHSSTDTETVILADRHLSQDEKDVLVRLYRTFRASHPSTDRNPTEGSRPLQQ
jgi:transcriptional regulator with XRE-family HTH domain